MKISPTRATLNCQTAELKIYAGSELVGTHDVFKELPENVACPMSQANALIMKKYGVYVQCWSGTSRSTEPVTTALGRRPIPMD
jgi:hypothetical protein